MLEKLSVCPIQANKRTFTTASMTSGLAILASPKDITLKEQIFRLRDGLKWRSESKKKSSIFMDLAKVSCCKRAYGRVCIYASVPCGWLGSNPAASCVTQQQESPFPPFPHFHLPPQTSTETLNSSLKGKQALLSQPLNPGRATAPAEATVPATGRHQLWSAGHDWDHSGLCWTGTRLPGPLQTSSQDQEMDGVDGERVWEAAGEKTGISGGHQKPIGRDCQAAMVRYTMPQHCPSNCWPSVPAQEPWFVHLLCGGRGHKNLAKTAPE